MPPRITSGFLSGGNYQSPGNRSFRFTASVDMGSLPTLPERLVGHLNQALIWHVEDAARKVISTARGYLVRLDEPPVRVNAEGKAIHGYDTGLLYITLIQRLQEHLLASGVFYDLLSEQAEYWRYVEFGFHTRSGAWWPGYHFLETAIHENEGYIRNAVRKAWLDTAFELAREAQVPGRTGPIIGLSRLA